MHGTLARPATQVDSTSTKLRRQLAEVYLNLALVQLEIRERKEGLQAFGLGAAILEQLVGDNPEASSFQNTLTRAYREVANQCAYAGQIEDAVSVWQRADAFWENRHKSIRPQPRFSVSGPMPAFKLGETYARAKSTGRGSYASSSGHGRFAVNWIGKRDGWWIRDTSLPEVTSRSATPSICQAGARSPNCWQQARDIWAELVVRVLTTNRYQSFLRGKFHNLGPCSTAQGRQDKALSYFRASHSNSSVAPSRDGSR